MISLILFAVAVVFYAISEAATFGKFKGDFWNNYNRKYKQPLEKAPSTWYYKFTVLKYRERFPGSGSIFVALADGMHLMQFLFKLFLCAAIVCYQPLFGWWDGLLYFAVFGLVFSVTYRITGSIQKG